MYAVVADVANYPEFVPWCVKTEKLNPDLFSPVDTKQSENETTVEYWNMGVGFKALKAAYVSRVTFTPYEKIDVLLFCCGG